MNEPLCSSRATLSRWSASTSAASGTTACPAACVRRSNGFEDQTTFSPDG